MLREEMDLITKLRHTITAEYNGLAKALVHGGPLMGLDEGRDSHMALVMYARSVGGVQAFQCVLDMIDDALQAREKALKGDDDDSNTDK